VDVTRRLPACMETSVYSGIFRGHWAMTTFGGETNFVVVFNVKIL